MSPPKAASGYSEESLAVLTEDEREALLDVEPGDDPADGDEGQDGPDEPEPQDADKPTQEKTAEKETEPPKADGAPTQAAETGRETPKPEPDTRATRETSFPKYEKPADAEAKLNELDARMQELATKFDDGDITAKEFYAEQRGILSEERTIRDGLLKAEMSEQAEAAAFTASVDRFLKANAAYVPGTPAYAALDAEVRRLQTETGDPFDPQHLANAHANLMAAFGGGAQKPTPTPDPARDRRPDPPPTLGNIPASDMQTIANNEFAHLDRLQGADYEAAFARLTPDQQTRYLAS